MLAKYKNILITGATSGIGEALAIYYAQNGAKNLFICGRNEQRLEKVRKECEKFGCRTIGQILDVTEKEKVKQWIDNCNKISPLQLVVANAGVATLKETPENIYKTFDTNLYGVLHTVLPTIEIYKTYRKTDKKTPLSIAIISSIAGYHGLRTCPSYSGSKAGVKAWGEGLRGSLKEDNINVSVVCPGFVRSRITDQNTCPMPFFWEADKAAKVIASRIEKNIGLIAFPWPVRFASWFVSILPNRISDLIYSLLPYKV